VIHTASINKVILAGLVLLLSVLGVWALAHADPTKYPQFAQQSLPENITPVFINIDELVEVVKSGSKPLIVDVRTDAEFKEAHILGAVSAPLAEFKDFLKSMPRDRPIVLY
jgi:hypothetical protein